MFAQAIEQLQKDFILKPVIKSCKNSWRRDFIGLKSKKMFT
jgi:hypothetical protein